MREGTEERYLLFVITNGQLQVSRDNPLLLVIPRSIACQLQDLSGEVLQDRREINWTSKKKGNRISHTSNARFRKKEQGRTER